MKRFREYKTCADFSEWGEHNKGVEIYCIYDSAGNELFDVAEDDFVKMLDLGLVDGDTRQLRADISENEIEGLCAEYGILWTDQTDGGDTPGDEKFADRLREELVQEKKRQCVLSEEQKARLMIFLRNMFVKCRYGSVIITFTDGAEMTESLQSNHIIMPAEMTDDCVAFLTSEGFKVGCLKESSVYILTLG